MKKLFFVCTVAVLMCSACKWFDNKSNHSDDGMVVNPDSLSINPDTGFTEMPDSTVKGMKTPTAEKEVATTTKPKGK